MPFRAARPMTDFQRVKQWLVFSRQWHIVDARGQDLDGLATRIARVLSGQAKPIYHPQTDCGDHVVVANCKDIAMRAFDWRRRDYFFDRQYQRSKILFPAFEIHQVDPCRLLFHETYTRVSSQLRRQAVERLHLFPDDEIPPLLLANVSNTLRQPQATPTALQHIPEEERAAFPQLISLPPDFASNEEILTSNEPLS